MYFAGRCDAFSHDQATLAALRARAPNSAEHVVLPELISRGPMGRAYAERSALDRDRSLVVYAMVNAEELGLSSTTIDGRSERGPRRVAVRRQERWLWTDARPRCGVGVPDRQAGRQYAESVERYIKPLGVERVLTGCGKTAA